MITWYQWRSSQAADYTAANGSKTISLGWRFSEGEMSDEARLATYLLQLNISKVIALLILRKQDEEDFCLCCTYYSRTEIKGLLQDKGISVRGFFIFKTN